MKQDRIVWSKELLSAQSIADQLGTPLVEIDPPVQFAAEEPSGGAESSYVEAASIPLSVDGVTLDFEPAVSDWQDADQVVVVLWVPEGIEPWASMRIDSSSHTPGLQGNDYVRCYYRYLHQGWGRVEFPYENMLIFGIPARWHEVSRVRLQLSGSGEGTFQIAAIRIEKRDRASGPRLTDEELLAALHLDGPGLEAVRRQVDAGDLERAKEALLRTYQVRERPRHPYATEPSPVAGYDTDEADEIRDHFILEQQLDADIDWRANPVGYLEWMHAFNRHFFLATLVEAYLATADEKYAHELDYLLSTWMRDSPVPMGNNGGGDPAWETLSTACRINNAWPRVWYALLESTAFQPATRLDMLKSFYEHAEHLIQYPTGHNWLVAESAALTTIGILFPEFERSEMWRAVGMERLEREIAYQVYPDGAQFELSPGYHRMCADLFADVYELALLNGHPVSRRYAQRLESMFEYTAYVTRPDGTRPSLNDAGALDTSSAPELLRGDELFGRPDLSYVATCGTQGQPPTGLSRAFPYAGHYVMRTGWDRDALWAVIDAGPFGAAHQHEDKLNLELYAYGTRFVVDPGIASYLDDPWTHYARSTAAHNTVLVDGQGQARRTNVPQAEHRVDRPGDARWGSSERLDYLWASYDDGYTGIAADQGLVHRRLVLFVKHKFWLIWDVLEGQGEHEMEVLYHFAPMLVQASETDGSVRSNRLGLPNIEFLPVGTPDEVEIVCGQQSPVQGWLAQSGLGRSRLLVPAPVARYWMGGRLPLAFGVVAAPFESGTTSGLSVQQVDAGSPGAAARLETTVVDASGNRYEVAFGTQRGEMACRNVGADALGLVVQRGPDGQIRAISGLACRQLTLNGVALVDREEPRPLVVMEMSGAFDSSA
jgi:hypothetical protein